jgi:drug/metabolite transporter (DMT)-like permease
VSETRPATGRILIPFAIITAIWGSTWIVILAQLHSVPPSWSVTYRFVVAGLCMFAYVRFSRATLAIGRDGQLLAVAIGITQFCLNFNFVYEAELHITSGLVSVCFGGLIVLNALLGRIFLKIPVTRGFMIGSAIAMSGVGLLFYNELRVMSPGATAVWVGLGCTLIAMLSASIANVMQVTERARALPLSSLLFWGMLYGAIFNAIWAAISAGPPTIDLSLTYLAALVYLGGIASALAFPVYFGLVREIGPAKAAYSGVITPIIAMLLSTLFEDYRWSAYAIGGGVLAVIGFVVALRERNPPPRPQPFGRDG